MEKDKYINGSIWQANPPVYWVAVLQYLTDDKFCLLSGDQKTGVMIAISEESGKWQYTREELPERLKNWQLIEDKKMSVVDKDFYYIF